MAVKLIRCAFYARFSCDKQRDASIEDQLYACNIYAEKHGYKVVAQYCDYAMTGRSDDRPQFLQMIEDAKQGAFDVIVVWKMNRFARNIEEQYYYEHVLRITSGVTFESTKENIVGNSIEATSNKALNALVAQIQSQNTSEDTMRGMTGKADKCQYLGYHRFGYSHEGDVITLDPVEAPMAKRIHTDYLAGVPILDICAWLKSMGVKTMKGNDPGYTFVTGILKNLAYAGVYIWGTKKDDEGEVILDEQGQPVPLVYKEGGMPAIVDMETKLACIKRLGLKKHSRTKANFMLSGKLYCSSCGNPLHGETATGKSGTEYFRYACQKKRKTCFGTLPKSEAEADVVRNVRALLRDVKLLEWLIDCHIEHKRAHKSEVSIKATKKELRELGRQRKNLLDAVADGLEYRHVKDRMAALDAQEEGLKNRIEKLERDSGEVDREDMLRFFSALSEGEMEDEDILRVFVNKIWLYEGSAVAVMNFDSRESSQYEIEDALNQHEHPVQRCSCNVDMVPPRGLEPPTHGLGNRRSIR